MSEASGEFEHPHTRTSTNGHGPDYCKECSDDVMAWVKWPCRVGTLEAEVERLRVALRIAHMHALQGGYRGSEDAGDRYLVRVALGAQFASSPTQEATDD